MKRPTRVEAPDGGWGILVCFGMAFPFISALSAVPSFGLVFADFLKEIGAESSAISFIISSFFWSFSFAGFFSGSLFKRYSLRTVGMIGGCLYTFGSFMQIFVQSTFHLLIAFSLIQGAGFGLMVPTSYTTFNNYFIKKRMIMMSFAQTLIGVGSMLYPVVMRKLLELYGFRGCLLILAALNSHAIFGMLLMQPVEWHVRIIPVFEEENHASPGITSVPSTSVIQEHISEQDPNHLHPLMLQDVRRHSYGISKEDLKIISSRASSITSLGNWTGSIVVSDISPEMTYPSTVDQDLSSMKKPSISKWKAIVNFFDLSLLKKPIYLNMVLGISFALYSDTAFFTLQPLYLFELDFSKSDTASIISIGAAADLGSRIFLALSAIFVQMPSRYIYLAGSFFTVIARFAFLQVNNFTEMALTTAAMGFLRTWIHVPLPLVFAEYLPKERFATGYGLFMFMQGNIMFIIGPIVGYLRDKTQDYILTFHVLNGFMAACAVPWLIEIFIVWFRHKNEVLPKIKEVNAGS